MSDLLNRYLESKKPRVTEARQIPGLAVNFVDQQNTFQNGFVTFEKPGDPTQFTERSLEYFSEERNNIALPESFVPLEPDIPINRWGPKNKYYTPGKPNSGQ